jgi:hypothetical protein
LGIPVVVGVRMTAFEVAQWFMGRIVVALKQLYTQPLILNLSLKPSEHMVVSLGSI